MGRRKRHLFQPEQTTMQHAAFALILGFIHFRGQIVMIEQETFAAQAPSERQQPIGFRWITGMNDIKASAKEMNPHR